MIVLFLLLLVTPTFTSEQSLFSDSVIIIKGENASIYSKNESMVRGVKTTIDWDQIPDLGVPKKEIFLIEVTKRQLVSHDGDSIKLAPSEWRFSAPTWVLEHEGSIPYLENLAFLSGDNLSMKNTIKITQNSLGYYQDNDTRISGLFQFINHPSEDTVSLIKVLSAEENQYIYDMSRKLDTQIISEEILNIQEKPAELIEVVTPSTNTTTEEDTVQIVEEVVEKVSTRVHTQTSIEKRENSPN